MLEIIYLYEEIWEIYSELWFLELQGMKDDVGFIRLVKLLGECLKKEDLLFSNLIRKYKYDYDKIIGVIMNNREIDNDDVRKRLYDYVVMYKMVYSKSINNYKSIDKLNRLYMSGFRNMYLLYFSYLEEFINIEIDDRNKALLLNLKYMESFYNHDMESVLVMNNFNVPINNYVDIDVVDSIVNLSYGMDEVKANYIDILLGLVVDILDINDDEYDKNRDTVMRYQCMFRACSCLIGDDEFENIGVLKLLFDRVNDNNRKSCELIISMINNRYKDMERVRRLSLNR